MVPISVGISGSLSAEQSPDQSVDKAGVPTSSVYCEYRSDDDFADLTWESPANVLVVQDEVEEIAQDTGFGSNTEEDVFSDWLRSHSESGPAEAAVDSVSFFGSDSAPSSLGCGDYDGIPQRPRGPMPPSEVIVPTSPCRLSPPPSPVAPNISAHEIASIVSYSRSLPSATSALSQSADNLSYFATQSTHEVETDSAIAVLTSESLASASEVRDSEVIDVALSTEVSAGDIGEHAFATWPSSYFKFDTEENSKESYSAIHSDPVHAELDSNDEREVLAARTSSRVHKAADSMREESNRCSDPSSFTTGPLEPHVSTPLSRDPQPSSLLEPSSSSFVSVTSLSILPSALSVSSSSMFVPSSSWSSSHSSSCLSPASSALFHDQVPLSRSISVLSPFANVSDDSFLLSSPAAVSHEAEVTCASRLNVTESPPILRPPEDPPPDVPDELRDWLHAYTILGIEERSPSSLSGAPSLPNAFDDMPDSPTPSDDFSAELRTTLSPATQATAAGPAIPPASGPLPTSSDSGDFSSLLAPNNEFEEDALPFSNIVENSPFCSYDSCNAFPAPRNNDERGLQTFESLTFAVPSPTSFDDSRPTLGYIESLLSPTTGFEVDALSLFSQELRNVVDAPRSDSAHSSRVSAVASGPKPNFAQPLREVSSLDEAPDYATHISPGVAWLTDLSPADEYNTQSEPEPPDPSCASH